MSNQTPYGAPPPQAPPSYGPPPGPPAYGPPAYGPPPGPQQQYWGPQGPPPQGPGFGWGSNGFPPPPPQRKKSKAGWIVLPIVVVVAGVVALWMWRQVSDDPGEDYTHPQPTYTSSYNPTEEPTSSSTTTQATIRPTQPTATKTATVAPPPSDSAIVTKNRIYRTGVQWTANCRESGARASSFANARKYYTQVLSCLDRAWPRQVNASGARFAAPRLVAFSGTVSTPCSGNAPSSFYCSSNQTIYMDASDDIKLYRTYLSYPNRTQATAWLRAEMTDTVAHEFGHHIQYMTGILRSSHNLEYEYSGDKSLEFSRRLEIQATCFGNVFMGSNKGSYGISGQFKKQLDWLHSHQGDEYMPQRDHGSRQVIPYWARRGFNSRNPGLCNTYAASSRLVR
ncbi:neutral zinc metallopeptidase [Kribbella antiqua]|uniref:neutral zinc metallopeptidase n=1 Tax=Kribbella antiqua TaxID=2512217 RepID=UPI00104EC438|nr:neutral zinc metallopeptidase [Kribbella antiqua]